MPRIQSLVNLGAMGAMFKAIIQRGPKVSAWRT
jgi:hypothetical protein